MTSTQIRRAWKADAADYPVTESLLAKRAYRRYRTLGVTPKAARWKTTRQATSGEFARQAARFA